MRIDGEWRLCDDGVLRPVLRGEIQASDVTWVEASFLVDSAADRTVFSADIWQELHLPSLPTLERIEGVGGAASSVVVETQIRLPREGGGVILFKGRFAALLMAESLERSVLGRDITNLFALIVDRPQDVVCLIGQGHRYAIIPG